MSAIQQIGFYHSVLSPFPLILFSAALICDLLHHFRWSKAFMAAHWLVIAGVLVCIPTIITGLAAAAPLNPEEFFLAKHRSLGYSTGFFGSLYAGLRIAEMRWKLGIRSLYYIGLSIMMVALVSWAGDYGSLVVEMQKAKGHPSEPQASLSTLGAPKDRS